MPPVVTLIPSCISFHTLSSRFSTALDLECLEPALAISSSFFFRPHPLRPLPRTRLAVVNKTWHNSHPSLSSTLACPALY